MRDRATTASDGLDRGPLAARAETRRGGAGRGAAVRLRLGAAAVLAAGVGLVGCGSGDDPPPATTTTAQDPALVAPDPQAGGTAYLALGDSLAQGVQRRGTTFGTTREGYPDQLATLLDRAGTPVRLSRIGCSGATVGSLIDGGRACSPDTPVPVPYANRDAATSQLAFAEAYLKARGDRPTLVTIDIGANDLVGCAGIDPAKVRSCFADGLPAVRERLVEVARRLRAAAGPNTVLAAMTYYDPALALARQPLAKPAAEAFHAIVRDQANPTIRRTFAARGFVVARVDRAFGSDGPASDEAVATACRLTRLCGRETDFHPNAEGYGVIAKAFEGVVKTPVAKLAG